MGRILARVAILHREAADIVGPVGHARHREIDPGRDLVAQIVPARATSPDHTAAPARWMPPKPERVRMNGRVSG